MGETKLAKDQILVLHDAVGCVIRCLSGLVWVTVGGDRRDHFLEADDVLAVSSDGMVIVEARRRAAVEVLRRPPPA